MLMFLKKVYCMLKIQEWLTVRLASVVLWVDERVPIMSILDTGLHSEDPSTMATGEEGGGDPTTMATFGEEGAIRVLIESIQLIGHPFKENIYLI